MVMKQLTLGIPAALLLTGISGVATAASLSAGQRMAERFLRGEVDAIWSAATPEMQEAFGSAQSLAAFHGELLANFGSEDIVLSERMDAQSGLEIYTRVSRWTQAPTPLEISIAFGAEGQIAGFLVRRQPLAAPSRFLDYQTKANLRLPVNREWFVYWGGRDIEDNYHAVDVSQRFALDLLVMRDGQSYSGDPSRVENYHCWGRPILAPADGVVLRAVDDLPDQAIGTTAGENPAGNHIVIDFGNDEYGVLAHLRKGSVSVAEGDTVAAGQEIGLCGNSGNTSEPHLHFHIQTSPKPGQGEGLPAQFTNYRSNGTAINRGEPQRGERILSVE